MGAECSEGKQRQPRRGEKIALMRKKKNTTYTHTHTLAEGNNSEVVGWSQLKWQVWYPVVALSLLMRGDDLKKKKKQPKKTEKVRVQEWIRGRD